MRGRINSVQPVLVMRVLDYEPVVGDSNEYTFDLGWEWGWANVNGVREAEVGLKEDNPNYVNLETFLKVKVDKNLLRDLDLDIFEDARILMYIPSTDTVGNRWDYGYGDQRFYSGWWAVTNVSPSLRQHKGAFYTDATVRALYSLDYVANSLANPSEWALRQYYEEGNNPLVNHPNPNTVDALENAVSNLSYTTPNS